MPNFDRMPNLFVIGAAKAGTTALYYYLAQHPQVFLSRVKEPEFFSQGRVLRKGSGLVPGLAFRRSGGLSCEGRGYAALSLLV